MKKFLYQIVLFAILIVITQGFQCVNPDDIQLKLYPNPVKEELVNISLEYDGKTDEIPQFKIKICDSNGGVYFEDNSGSAYSRQINVSGYPNGVYIVAIIGKNPENNEEVVLKTSNLVVSR